MLQKMISRVIKKIQSFISIKNKALLDSVGEHTQITGSIEKRISGSTIKIGKDCLIEGLLVTETTESSLIVGDNTYIGGGTVIDCVKSISIGDDVLISYGCILSDSDNHSVKYSIRKKDLADWKQRKHDWTTTNSKAIQISTGVWIGARAIILKGVTIGKGSVVGAGSVVTKDIPPWTIVAGNPARVIREIAENER